jgi:hypothetical protein
MPFLGVLQAQGPKNPFELRHRIADAIQKEEASLPFNPGNPFELRVRPNTPAPTVSIEPKPKRFSFPRWPSVPTTSEPANQLIQIKFWLTITLLVSLTFLLTLFRHASVLAFAGFFNDNQFFYAYREQQGRGILPYIALYALFPVGLGSFIFFAAQYYSLQFLSSPLAELSACIALTTGAILLKHGALATMSALYPAQQEISRYNFLMVVFGVVTGLLLVPVNILLAFGPEHLHDWLVPGTAAAIGLIYLFRFLRGVVIANKFLLFHRFHFLLYICTVEIAPVLNFVKLLTGWNEI